VTAPNHRPLLTFDCSANNHLVAAGGEYQNEEAPILFWDIRFPERLLRTHTSTHSDDITNLAFVPVLESEILLSGSTDGLLSSSNPFEDDEDEAVINAANWGTSISKTGFIHQAGKIQHVWTASDMETFAIWNLEVRRLHFLLGHLLFQ
jgi:WD repeat-containing protein 89